MKARNQAPGCSDVALSKAAGQRRTPKFASTAANVHTRACRSASESRWEILPGSGLRS